METTIWILKGLLAALFAFAGLSKLFLPKAKVIDIGMKSLINLGEQQIKGIGLLEVLGSAGLILPGLLNICPILSGIAALCLGFLMIAATRTHLQLKLPVIPNLIILAVCFFIAYREFFA